MINPKSILIVRLSAIGDVIHTLPALHLLRRRFPDARIGWVVEEMSAALLRGHPELDRLYVIPKKRWRREWARTFFSGEKSRFFRAIRRDCYDVAIDFHGLTKSGWVAWRSGAKVRVGYGDHDGRECNKLFTNVRIHPRAEARHVIDRNLELLRALEMEPRVMPVEFTLPRLDAEKASMGAWLQGAGVEPERGILAYYPGAGWPTKRWPPESFARLARLLDGAPGLPGKQVLVYGPGEESLCRRILEKARLPESRLFLAPPTGLRELAALLGFARLVIGGDTGPVHLAGAIGVPVVSILGGSDTVRNGVYGQEHWALTSDLRDCLPCWKKECALGASPVCLTDVTPEAVAEKALLRVRSEEA